MFNNTCVVTGQQFKSKHEGALFCPSVSKQIRKLVLSDPQLKKEIVSEMVQDAEVVGELATAIMATECQSIGLKCPGTVSEMFSRSGIGV